MSTSKTLLNGIPSAQTVIGWNDLKERTQTFVDTVRLRIIGDLNHDDLALETRRRGNDLRITVYAETPLPLQDLKAVVTETQKAFDNELRREGIERITLHVEQRRAQSGHFFHLHKDNYERVSTLHLNKSVKDQLQPLDCPRPPRSPGQQQPFLMPDTMGAPELWPQPWKQSPDGLIDMMINSALQTSTDVDGPNQAIAVYLLHYLHKGSAYPESGPGTQYRPKLPRFGGELKDSAYHRDYSGNDLVLSMNPQSLYSILKTEAVDCLPVRDVGFFLGALKLTSDLWSPETVPDLTQIRAHCCTTHVGPVVLNLDVLLGDTQGLGREEIFKRFTAVAEGISRELAKAYEAATNTNDTAVLKDFGEIRRRLKIVSSYQNDVDCFLMMPTEAKLKDWGGGQFELNCDPSPLLQQARFSGSVPTMLEARTSIAHNCPDLALQFLSNGSGTPLPPIPQTPYQNFEQFKLEKGRRKLRRIAHGCVSLRHPR